MSRDAHGVGLVRCQTDAATMNSIVSIKGLRALPTDSPNLFLLANSGRSVEPEIGSDLLAAAEEELDHAARNGTIPPWSLVARHETAP